MSDLDAVERMFVELLKGLGIDIGDRQLEQFCIYHRELTEWNEKMNLTAITEKEQVYIKHFYDSISLSFFVGLDSVNTIADIGSGAGFPSIPLKIVFPNLRVTIIDSLNKRITFLNHLVGALGLDGVECVHARAEEAGRNGKYRDRFDLVTARAVARLNVLGEFCLPFTKPGGHFVAMKGSNAEEEIEEAAFGMRELKAEFAGAHEFKLPIEESTRYIVVYKKRQPTPGKYPRKPGTPLKMPLVGK